MGGIPWPNGSTNLTVEREHSFTSRTYAVEFNPVGTSSNGFTTSVSAYLLGSHCSTPLVCRGVLGRTVSVLVFKEVRRFSSEVFISIGE
jgi:hypothetical protein